MASPDSDRDRLALVPWPPLSHDTLTTKSWACTGMPCFADSPWAVPGRNAGRSHADMCTADSLFDSRVQLEVENKPEAEGGHTEPLGRGWACCRSSLVIFQRKGGCLVRESLEKILWPRTPERCEGDPVYFYSCFQPNPLLFWRYLPRQAWGSYLLLDGKCWLHALVC